MTVQPPRQPGIEELHGLAAALFEKGDHRAALSCLERAVALEPRNAHSWLLRGNVLQRSHELAASVACYHEALRLKPDFPQALNNLAAAQRGLRQLEDAYASAERALALRPAYPLALNNRGLIALDAKRGAAAVEDFRRALALKPGFPEALHNLGTALMQLKRFAEASEAFAQLVRLASDFAHAAGNLLNAKLCNCDWAGFEPLSAAVTQAVERGEHAATPMSFLCLSDSAALQLRCAQAYTSAFFPECGAGPRARCGHDKIRVAYLSGDLGEHAVTYLLAGVLERHDAARFQTIALAWDRRADISIRRRVAPAFARFIDVGAMSDAEVVRLMRDMEVDIAVDLCGHTLGQRTAILANRAARIQVNYLGLPATMGAPYMDYLIADPFLIPEPQQPFYAEKVVWLDGAFQPNDDRRPPVPEAPPRSALGLPDEALVLCSFNRTCKLNPLCFEVWMRLLAALPGCVLWLLAPHATAAENLRREAAARGVAPGRLIFADEAPYLAYLARYRHVDLFLDTWPFNGGATVSDALSMGVPVLTLAGSAFAARMAGSLLQNLGFPELVTTSPAAYEEAARELGQDPARLRSLRERLQQRRLDHAFFDTDRYRMNLEAAFQMMWERHAAGLPPAAFAVPRGAPNLAPTPNLVPPPGLAPGASTQAATAEACSRSNGPTNGA
jgi:predicted O-linked N-acetylglucosamine transferase (SPINDLY family)